MHTILNALLRALLFVFPPPPPHPPQDDLMALADCLYDDNATIPTHDLPTAEFRKVLP